MRICNMRLFSKRFVPINCRTPSVESTKLTRKEKLEWAAFIAVLTIIPVGVQLWQFYATSSVVVNRGVAEELARRRGQNEGFGPNSTL
jgi:hypothetical protein